MRNFVNKLPDFKPGTRVQVDHEYWKRVVLNITTTIVEKMPPTFENCDGSVYVGCPGVAYMFYYLANSEPFADMKDELLTRAKNYVDVSLSHAESKQNRDPPAAFLLGKGGVYAVGSMVYQDVGKVEAAKELNKKYLAAGSVCQPLDFMSCGGDELLVGRAGYICGALALNRKFGQVINKTLMYTILNAIITSGQHYVQRHQSKSPLMYSYYSTEYLGAAHGLSGILLMLLYFPEYLKSSPDVEKLVKQAVEYMLGIMQPNGNIAPATDELGARRRPESEELVHWCHGAPGVVYLFAKAFLLWKDERYLTACMKCAELTWQKGLLKKGPGICHGVAGSGYVFLLLYRLTADEQYLHRALKFAEFTQDAEFMRNARRPDCPFSLYEGLAGTACFLTDLMQPHKAEFPFFDVYQTSNC